MAVPSTTWNEAIPTDNDDVGDGNEEFQTLRTQLREIIAVDHKMENTGSGTTWGYHKYVTLIEVADLSALSREEEGIAVLGAETHDGKPELSYLDEDSNDVQITRKGDLNIPAGIVVTWGGSILSLPSGWLLCDNTPAVQATYPDLYAVLGTIHGSPGGGNFSLPDLRNRFVVGAGDTYSVADYDDTPDHTHTIDSHTHTISTHTHGVGSIVVGTPSAGVQAGVGGTQAGDISHNHPLTGTTDAGGTSPTAGSGELTSNINGTIALPPYYALAFIIKT